MLNIMKIFDARSNLNRNKTHSQAHFILNYSTKTKVQVFIVGGSLNTPCETIFG